ncbi:MAG: glycosyl hydrolase family 8 [Actinomycetales bacterium]
MLGRCLVGVAAAVSVTVAVTACGGSASRPAGPAKAPGGEAAAAFLSRYVTSDGRVLRHDQGGDIVSEGQAYAMLIAESADRPEQARTIWQWTKAHLRRADGLLAFHASGTGAVLDDSPASDADTLAAYALLRYRGSGQSELHADGAGLARAVLHAETVDSGGAPVLIAGTWATGPPATVNPSYWMPGVFTALARLTGSEAWRELATTTEALLAQVTDGGRTLPPDWAQLQAGRLTPVAAPDGSAGVRYGLDAARLPLWLASSCDTPARTLAAAWWRNVLSQQDRAAAMALGLNGDPIDSSTNPVPLLAAAAAADAAGDRNRSSALRQRASAQVRAAPTYYGDAWLALDQALQHKTLDPCHESR